VEIEPVAVLGGGTTLGRGHNPGNIQIVRLAGDM
jgi:hypothetical protein